jgi:hypothetical protein
MKPKLTAKELYYSHRCQNYESLTPAQQAVFRGSVTWRASCTYLGSEDATYIEAICKRIEMPVPAIGSVEEAVERNAHPMLRQLMVPIYKLLMVKDSAIRATIPNRVKQPADIYNLLTAYSQDLDREHLIVILLDTKNAVIGINTVTIGSLNTAVVTMREIFKPAILANAAAIIVSHNHPSGDPTPSAEDVAVTRQIVDAGKLLSIDVLDHIVCGDSRWVSLKERGLGF